MLLIMFSFFEMKIPPPILPEVFVLIFAKSVSSVSVNVSKSFVCFSIDYCKSQKQNGSSESLIEGTFAPHGNFYIKTIAKQEI